MPLPDAAKQLLDAALSEAAKGGFRLMVVASNVDTEEVSVMSSISNDPDVVADLAIETLTWLTNQEETARAMPPPTQVKRSIN